MSVAEKIRSLHGSSSPHATLLQPLAQSASAYALPHRRERRTRVFANELDLPAGTVSDAAQRMIDRAAAEARRRGHGEVLSAHLFFGFVQTEWTLFDAVMRDAGANSHAVALANEESLAALPS